MKNGITLSLRTENDAFDAAGMAMHLAERTGFAHLECQLIATAVSEISTNAIRYAGKGRINIGLTGNNKGLSILVEDNGPGIGDTRKAMADGFTTSRNSLGVGLGAARRAMDFFQVDSQPGKGTRIRMEKYLPLPSHTIQYGIASLPDEHYDINGDGWLIKEYSGDKVLVAVIDGLGQGQNAYHSSSLAKAVIEENLYAPLDVILNKCHTAFKDKGRHYGASIGLLLIKPGSFQYAAVGDTFLKFLTGRRQQLTSQRGIVGQFRMPVVRIVKKTASKKGMLFALCTDGIKDHFTGADVPTDGSIQEMAAHIITRYRREFGDATVLIVKTHC
ncbi:MAG TPA: ATP-binding protein [Puia sp.]|nr:ATP-binding protein [Puia sp.]